jgi:hypothetical protein
MKKIVAIVYVIFVVLMLTILLLNINGYISFGNGLGDIKTLFLLTVLNILIFWVWLKFIRKVSLVRGDLLFVFTLILILVLTFLKLTIWRGREFPWNGAVFL